MTTLSLINQLDRPTFERRPTTKLWSRSHATARLEEEMKRATPDTDCAFSIFLVQFDGLGDEAARLGYAFADDMARRAKAVLTPELGPQDMCCRLGGDEFLLIFGGRRHSDCGAIVDRIHERWNAGAAAREESTIEMSIGVASFPEHGRSIEALLSAADEAMQASRMGSERPQAPAEIRVA